MRLGHRYTPPKPSLVVCTAFASLLAALPPWKHSVSYRSQISNLHRDPRWEQYLRQIGLWAAQRKAIDFEVILPL